jgi:tRNA 5-methylaminomethyl-2-thiouridine biosynthesis bifunctional protein
VPRDRALAPLAAELARRLAAAHAEPAPPRVRRRPRAAAARAGRRAHWLPELDARVDAFYLDGFAPSKNPQMWQPRLFKAMAASPRRARPPPPGRGAPVRDGLAAAGFEVRNAPGQGGKRDITWRATRRRTAPSRHRARRAARCGRRRDRRRRAGRLRQRLGAGAARLALHGARPPRRPRAETSGNPAGIFHGIVHAQDGVHAALLPRRGARGAAAHRRRRRRDGVPGRSDGLLRLETSGLDAAAMQALLERLGLPGDYVQVARCDARPALRRRPRSRIRRGSIRAAAGCGRPSSRHRFLRAAARVPAGAAHARSPPCAARRPLAALDAGAS